jgi:hypothetical protein
MRPLAPLAGALAAGALALVFGRRAFASARTRAVSTSRLLTLCALTTTVALKLALGATLRWWAVLALFAGTRLALSLLIGRTSPRSPPEGSPPPARPTELPPGRHP